MKKVEKNIDFSILWKKINSKVTEKDDEVLSNWTKETRSHQEYYTNAKNYFESNRIKNESPINSKGAWLKVQKRIGSRSPRKNQWIPIACSIAAMLLVALVLIQPNEPTPIKQVVEAKTSTPPGRQKATLIMDNGESINLEKNKNFNAKIEGAEIHTKGTNITYLSEEKEVEQIRYNTLEIPKGAEYFVTLSDGTKVWLNSDSRLTYPVQFPNNERLVKLEGEAYFEVTKNEKSPFKVLSHGQVVKVLGTSFNVNAYNSSGQVSTTLLEGKVNVYLEDRPNVSRILTPGDQASVSNAKIHVKKVDVKQYTAWKDGIFQFKNQTLEQMMIILARWYNVDVSFENQTKKELRFTGELQRYKNLENILELLEMTYEISFEKEGNSIVVR